MNVHLQFEAQLRQLVGTGKSDLELPDGTDLRSALRHVTDADADLREKLLSPDGEAQPSLLVFVNEQPVPAEAVAVYILKDGDTVLLLPPISGG